VGTSLSGWRSTAVAAAAAATGLLLLAVGPYPRLTAITTLRPCGRNGRITIVTERAAVAPYVYGSTNRSRVILEAKCYVPPVIGWCRSRTIAAVTIPTRDRVRITVGLIISAGAAGIYSAATLTGVPTDTHYVIMKAVMAGSNTVWSGVAVHTTSAGTRGVYGNSWSGDGGGFGARGAIEGVTSESNRSAARDRPAFYARPIELAPGTKSLIYCATKDAARKGSAIAIVLNMRAPCAADGRNV